MAAGRMFQTPGVVGALQLIDSWQALVSCWWLVTSLDKHQQTKLRRRRLQLPLNAILPSSREDRVEAASSKRSTANHVAHSCRLVATSPVPGVPKLRHEQRSSFPLWRKTLCCSCSWVGATWKSVCNVASHWT